MDRVNALKQEAFQKRDFDGFLISNEFNLLYLTGIPRTSCLLVTREGESTIYVYGVNYEQAKAEARGFSIELAKRGEDLMEKVVAQVKTDEVKKLAADTLSIESYCSLKKALKGKTRLKIHEDIIWKLRRVKDEGELELMRKAGELASMGMKVAHETIRPGMSEIQVAAEIEYAMRKGGSWGTAFETAVASGTRSAFPHGGCTDRIIRRGDLIVVDFGATYQHYRSDMTRTLAAGKPSEKQERIYKIVRSAQEAAFQAIKPGAKARDVDATARRVIANAGYEECFVHGLGHGVGLEVHEPPALSPQSKDRLIVRNVVTNEPGVYIAGFGGVRIEDTVLVQERQAEKLTTGAYTLSAER